MVATGMHEYVPLPALDKATSAKYSGRISTGCYLLNYKPVGNPLVMFDGTLRLDASSGPLLASADLYTRDTVFIDGDPPVIELGPAPNAAAGIPIFPVFNYRSYLLVTKLNGTAESFTLAFDTYVFSAQRLLVLDGSATSWLRQDTLTASMTRAPAPAGYPSPKDYFVGDVKNAEGTMLGRLTMGLVSPFLRRATVRMDHVDGSEEPLTNGTGETWKTVFEKVGWDLTVVRRTLVVENSGGEFWSGADAHAAMMKNRGEVDLNKEWVYYVLAVHRIKAILSLPELGERGFMFDSGTVDTDKLPREGLLIASHWPIPMASQWGMVQGKRTGETVTHFRTAVHELGHAMGLDHNSADLGFMSPTDSVATASLSTPDKPFPTNISWRFARDDEHRLRHWPDLVVRPGGANVGFGDLGPAHALASDRLELEAKATLSSVPLAAPVRVDIAIVNGSGTPGLAPPALGLMEGTVRGEVIDPNGTARRFAPLVVNEDPTATKAIPPGEHLAGSLTLLRGPDGALFPRAGRYRIVVEAFWSELNLERFARGATTVTVTAAADVDHASAARIILGTAETLLTLALGGDHVPEGLDAVRAGLNNPVLRPHFAYIEAKRLANGSGGRKGDAKSAANLINDATVMSAGEAAKATRIVETAQRD